jgi:predicted small lipoprotein YifL
VKKLAAILFLCAGLMACGQTGELFLPDQDNSQQSS